MEGAIIVMAGVVNKNKHIYYKLFAWPHTRPRAALDIMGHTAGEERTLNIRHRSICTPEFTCKEASIYAHNAYYSVHVYLLVMYRQEQSVCTYDVLVLDMV